ncbi:MAG TPA: hypothetical protein VLM75_07550 [Spirochaetota bacterium]|nr:hypothetical protein [Spirochaetota bacterium]
MSQVTANTNKFIFGSGDFQIGSSIETLASMGALRGAVFTEEWEEVEIETDNAGRPIKRIKNQKAKLAAGLLELDLNRLNVARGGLDVLTPVAGTIVGGEEQLVVSGTWVFNEVIPIEHQNGDGTIITVNSVVGSTNAVLVEGTDYFVVLMPDGRYGVMPIDSATFTTAAQNLTIDYDYTPNASIKFTSGGKFTINPRVCRLIHTDANGKKLQLTIYAGKVAKGFEFTFPSDDADDVMETSFEMVGDLDTTRTAGDQLYEIIDERSYS